MTVTINGTTGLATDSASAVVETVSLNHPSSATAAITLDASDNVTLAGDLSVDTDTLYVDSTNNRVGIGTSSPAAILELSDANNLRFDLGTDGTNEILSVSGSDDLSLRSGGSANILFKNGSSEAMRITNSGNINVSGDDKQIYWGSGTTAIDGSSSNSRIRFYTSNAERMSLQGDALTLTNTKTGVTSSAMVFSNAQASGAYRVRFDANSSVIGDIRVTTSSVAYNTTSDARLKENVVDLTGAIDRVNQIPVHRFNFIADPDRTVDGFLAHEVQAVVPEAVTGTQDGMRDEEYEVTPAVLDDDGNVVTEAVMGTRSVPDYQGIDQSKLVPLLTAALREALVKIETLETEMTSVKSRLDALETP